MKKDLFENVIEYCKSLPGWSDNYLVIDIRCKEEKDIFCGEIYGAINIPLYIYNDEEMEYNKNFIGDFFSLVRRRDACTNRLCVAFVCASGSRAREAVKLVDSRFQKIRYFPVSLLDVILLFD